MQTHDEIFNSTIFEKKTFSDLLKEIYLSSKQKEKQITILIEELRPLVKTIGDATIIMPLIKEYMDVSVKNDELLVKMAAIIQRTLQTKIRTEFDISSFNISQEEIDALEQEFSANKKAITQTEAKISDAIKKLIVEEAIELKDGERQ